jgi:tetratricopeptide (TPR) repeat protein
VREEGNAAFAAGHFESAAEIYSKAISLDPTDALPWCNRSAAYLKANMAIYAWGDAVHASTLDRTSIKAGIRSAMANEAMNLFDEAEEFYCSLLPDVD